MKLPLLLLGTALAASSATAAPRGFTVEDLVHMERVGSPVLSPDASRVLYTVRATNMDKNRGNTQLWLLDLRAPKAAPVRLTQADASARIRNGRRPAMRSTSCPAAPVRRRSGVCRWPAAKPAR
jgi:dipeptidyl aminopeptidase/acylaminoacyl peptidase